MRILDGLHPLITPREGKFLPFIGRSRTDDAHDGDKAVNFPHVAHAAETRHRRAFNMMNRARIAAGDHLPHVLVAPRLRGFRISEQKFAAGFLARHAPLQIHFNSAPAQHGFDIPHRSQSALRQNVHFDQADFLDRIHVEMRRGIAFVCDESRRQLVHRLAREHEAARVHFGITRHAVQKLGHFERGFVRLIIEGQVPVFRTGFEHFNQSRAAAWRRFIRHPAAAETPREMFGELPHLAFRHAQHFRHFRKGALGLERREPADHGAVVRGRIFQK